MSDMEKKEFDGIWNYIQDNYSKIENCEPELLYTKDPITGELIPIAEKYPEEAEKLAKEIHNRINGKNGYAMISQSHILRFSRKNTSRVVRLLLILISKVNFNNKVVDYYHSDAPRLYGMSVKTSQDVMKELLATEMIKRFKERGNHYVYYISPYLCWKGNYIKRSISIKEWND